MAIRKLTETELQDRANELAEVINRYEVVEDEKKTKAKDYADQLKELRSRMTVLAAEIRDKHCTADQETLPFREVLDDEPLGARRGGKK